MIYIYSKELKPKKIFDINLPLEEAIEYTGGNLYIDHPEINPIDCIEVERPQEFKNPIYLNGVIREMTREEDVIINGNISALQPGEYIKDNKIETINIPNDDKIYDWDLSKKEWIYNEEKTQEKREKEKQNYFNKIDEIKAEILEKGYEWKGHNQRCRDKDVTLMTSTIEALKDYKELNKQELSVTWYFSDNDSVVMALSDMQNLRLVGTTFVQKVYDVENKLKTSNIQKITKENFLDLLKM